MRLKRIFCMGGICIFLILLSSLLASGDAWGQAPLTINYSNLTMNCGGSQNLSASGGCPPYNWVLFGGGTLTPSGGDNASATYIAPASNPNCANNAMITLTDYCKNSADIQIAVNCYSSGYALLRCEGYTYNCHVMWCNQPNPPYHWVFVQGAYYAERWLYDCAGNVGQHDIHNYNPYNFGQIMEPPCWVDPCYPGQQLSDVCCPSNPPCGYATSAECSYMGQYPCGSLNDVRTTAMKTGGCCPINPETGEPYGDGSPGSEDRGKGGGEDPNYPCTDNYQGNPVNVATGNKFEKSLDLSISTPGIPLEFKRSYNSQITFDAPLGY